jgi:ABC-2 type transport system ATP-binding protein
VKGISLFGAIRGRDLNRAGLDLAARFDLDTRVPVRAMSRGMRQKLGLILALAPAPRLLVLDEPTSGLDPLMQHLLHDVLRELANKGHTVFFSSHSLSEVEELCDRVAIVREGELVANESLAVLRQRAGHDVTIHWQSNAQVRDLEPPSFLKLTRREGLVWQGALEGPPQRLIDFLAGKPLADLSIGRPDLESLFKRFYTLEGKP